MPENYILVDLENVSDFDLKLLKREGVNVIVFVGCSQAKVSTELVMGMQALGPRGIFIRMSGNGPNALDFHIAFTMGELWKEGESQFFHVISKDQGFDPLIAYMKSRKIMASRYTSLAEITFLTTNTAPTNTTPTNTIGRAEAMVEYFSNGKHTKPRTVTTLKNLMKTRLGKELSDVALQQVIERLAALKIIKVDGTKVSYF